MCQSLINKKPKQLENCQHIGKIIKYFGIFHFHFSHPVADYLNKTACPILLYFISYSIKLLLIMK